MSIGAELQYGGRFDRWRDFIKQFPDLDSIKPSSLLTGKQLANLSYSDKLNYAQQVCVMLSLHPNTMLQFKPEGLIHNYMDKNLSALIVNNGIVLSFAKLYPWTGVSDEGKNVFELGSWITKKGCEKKGYGSQVAKAVVKQAYSLTENPQVVALTEIHNQGPQKILQDLGGLKLANLPSTVKVLLGEGKAELVCFDMTDIVATA